MNVVSWRMGLRRLPGPRRTEKVVDLLHFQTTHLVHCDSISADEKQRLYHAVGLNLSSVTACRAVSLFDTIYTPHRGVGQNILLNTITSERPNNQTEIIPNL